jgi:hypothetical protein
LLSRGALSCGHAEQSLSVTRSNLSLSFRAQRGICCAARNARPQRDSRTLQRQQHYTDGKRQELTDSPRICVPRKELERRHIATSDWRPTSRSDTRRVISVSFYFPVLPQTPIRGYPCNPSGSSVYLPFVISPERCDERVGKLQYADERRGLRGLVGWAFVVNGRSNRNSCGSLRAGASTLRSRDVLKKSVPMREACSAGIFLQ